MCLEIYMIDVVSCTLLYCYLFIFVDFCFLFFFFFFKQKTAYEMRISDWSSDVCSSDLQALEHHTGPSSLLLSRQNLPALAHAADTRSEERRVGKECVSTCRSRWSPYH